MSAKLKRKKRNDGGSVLMEFLIVAPLYLLLFGGLMLISEILFARMNLWNHDRMLAWIADDRRHTNTEVLDRVVDIIKTSFELPDIHINEAGETVIKTDHYDFENENINDDEWAAASKNDSQAQTQYIQSNYWCRMYNSQIPLKMNTIPASIRGPMAVVGIFSGDSDSPIPVIDFYREGSIHLDQRNLDRHYVVHRYAYNLADSNAHDRDATGSDLYQGVVWNIIGEPWIRNEETTMQNITQPQQNNQGDFSYQRFFLSAWSE